MLISSKCGKNIAHKSHLCVYNIVRLGGIVLKTALIVIFLIISIALAVIVMMQEGKDNGLTATMGGSTDTYWSKNKGRSKEAVLMKITIVLGILYMVVALLLSSKFI